MFDTFVKNAKNAVIFQFADVFVESKYLRNCNLCFMYFLETCTILVINGKGCIFPASSRSLTRSLLFGNATLNAAKPMPH